MDEIKQKLNELIELAEKEKCNPVLIVALILSASINSGHSELFAMGAQGISKMLNELNNRAIFETEATKN